MAEIYPWQQQFLNDFMKYQGRGIVQITGRNAGKNTWTNKAIERLMHDLASRPVEQLVLNEGTVLGARYYTVEPIGGNWMDMETWCLDTFGEAGSIWQQSKDLDPTLARYYFNDRRIWFREKKDRDWFVIRWNS